MGHKGPMQPASGDNGGAAQHLRCYLNNLAALYTLDAPLAAQIEALPFASLPALEDARDGRPTVRLTADDGKEIYAHSRYKPLEEARMLVETQVQRKLTRGEATEPPGGSDGGDDLEYTCFVASGLGLGHHVAELDRRFSRPLIIVVEDDLALIKAALCVSDLSAPMRERRMAFLISNDKSRLHERLRPIMAAMMLGLTFITPAYTRRYHARFHTEMSAMLRDFVSFARLQVVSTVQNARTTCKNCAYNLPAYLRHPGVETLTGKAAGYPAIVVAAGPSLSRNIDQLKELRSRAVIIAVQTVLKPLLARGIPPHFVASLDYHAISAQFFEGIEDFGETALVAEPKVAWPVIETFRGRTHVLHSEFLSNLLREAGPARGRLRAGSTVAQLCYYLAEHLGCDPIILVGQDLSFTEGLFYPPGTQIENVWRPELGRFCTVEMKQWERIVRRRAGLHVVKDIHGRNVYTDDQMFSYAEQFQSDFAASPRRVIHATEGGMRLESTEVMTLRAAAEKFCTRELPADFFAESAAVQPRESAARAVAAIEQRLGEIREMRSIATETDGLLARLEGLLDRPREFNRLIVRVDELRARMRRNDRTYNLVSHVSQLAELRRLQADDQVETPASARRRLKRDREYVSAFIEGCGYLEEMLPHAVQRIREQFR
jgi:hypothetical protein